MTPNLNDPTSEAPLLSAEPSRRSGHDLKRLIFCVLGLGVCGILLLPTTRQELAKTANVQAATTEQTEVLPVETVIAKPVDGYSVQRTYTGALAAQRSSDLGFERGGRLVAVLVQEGDRIRQDQPLARLDTSNLRTQRRQLEAEKVRAMAQLAELRAGPRAEDIAAAEAAVRDLEQQLLLQQAQYSRRQNLYRKGAISAEELDEFSFGRNALQARLEQAESQLDELNNGTRQEQITAQIALVKQLDASIADVDVTIAKSTVRAPFNGVVSVQSIDEGTVVSAGQTVIKLIEASALEARIGIPTETASQLTVGASDVIAVGEQTYPARIITIMPEVDPQTRTQTVVWRLDNAIATQTALGQTARVEVSDTVAGAGFWLPTAAMTQGIRGLWECYVVTESVSGYVVEQQAVEILHQTNNEVLVRGTLRPGDRIVASGTHRLVPGQQVALR